MHRLSASNKATQKSKPTNTKKINLAVKSKKNASKKASKKAAETSKFSMTTTTTTTTQTPTPAALGQTQTRPALAINAQDVLAAYDRIKCMFSTCFDFLPSFIYLLFFPPH